MPTLAIDCSNYTGPISDQQAQDLYAAGVRRAIVQAVNERVFTHRWQIPALLAAGIEVQGYVYVWYSAGPDFIRNRVAWACNELSQWPAIRHIWADCEQSDENDPPFDYRNADKSYVFECTRAAIDTIADKGFGTGIYTGRWWWVPGTGDSHYFSSVFPLWDAHYDLDPDIDRADYGGWTLPQISQYRGDTSLVGVHAIDLNSYEAPAVIEPPSLAERTLEEIYELVSAYRAAK